MRKLLLIFSCSILLPIHFTYAKQVNFKTVNFEVAKSQASLQGKLFFVDFVANYCFLCKLMDETTFLDENLIDYVEQHYIPIKVNVDDFINDGYAWKKKFKVKVLPTILIFNSRGEEIKRLEESMSASRLLTVLEEYNQPQNRKKTNPPNKESEEDKPVIFQDTSDPNEETTPSQQVPPSNPSGGGLYEFTVKRHPSRGFGVQIGAFAMYGNVLREVEKLQQKFGDRKIIIHISELNGKVVYKVVVGTFDSRNQAVSYRKRVMRLAGVDGIIKDFSGMK